MRKVCYVTGTRADFGLMLSTLQQIHTATNLELMLAVTGMHLLEQYGSTVTEIKQQGFNICATVPVTLSGQDGSEMAFALADQISGFTQAWQANKPDIVLLLGDRGEMLAAAIAAVHLNIPVVHIHGGERSGTIDESIRHAVSKLAHYHFTATSDARRRLINMGEHEDKIFVTGAPGLDAILATPILDKEELLPKFGLNPEQAFQLVLFHPVVQQGDSLVGQIEALLDAVLGACNQPLVLMPNADSGSQKIVDVIQRYAANSQLRTAVHIPRTEFLSLMAHADVLIGNSSSGIIESASLGTPVVNVGNRQNQRERNANVTDVKANKTDIQAAINIARQMKGQSWDNCYGSGSAGKCIVDLLESIEIDSMVLEKINAY